MQAPPRKEGKMADQNPDGQRAVTADEFRNMTPEQQGYITYMQAAWNRALVDKCPYRSGTPEYVQFCQGEQRAIIEVQDSP